MRTKLPTRPHKTERLQVKVDPGQKAELFAIAAQRGESVSHLLRDAARRLVSEAD